jgi:hypothetical protein
VHVVTGIDDLDKTIDEVLDAQASLARALEAIGSVAPTAA